MSEKIILLTGSTDGIGKQTALQLARLGERVILHGRVAERIARTQQEILADVQDAKLETALADLASLEQVRALAHDIQTRFDRLDVLINNAGVYMRERQLSVDGYELTFAVNHLAPFVLTLDLLPLLRTSHARVVTVASMVHNYARIDFENLNGEKHFDGYSAYSQSKLANILFANELAERERGRLTSNSLHPGVIKTKLLSAGFDFKGDTAANGAATSVFLATAPQVAGVTGRYFSDRSDIPPSPQALDRATQARLWEISERMTGERYK